VSWKEVGYTTSYRIELFVSDTYGGFPATPTYVFTNAPNDYQIDGGTYFVGKNQWVTVRVFSVNSSFQVSVGYAESNQLENKYTS
jgi:hypothetical protein